MAKQLEIVAYIEKKKKKKKVHKQTLFIIHIYLILSILFICFCFFFSVLWILKDLMMPRDYEKPGKYILKNHIYINIKLLAKSIKD